MANKHEHKHDHDCECGCGCGEMEEYNTVELELEDGSTMECAVIDLFELDGQEYIVLLPITEDDEEELLLYRYTENDDETFSLDLIGSEEEYQKVCDYFESNSGYEE